EFNAVVTDAATNVEGASLSNTATVATGGRTLPPATADGTVREPVLSISKAVVETDSEHSRLLANGDLENADVGEEVTFRVTLSNAADAVAAHNVKVSDEVPTEYDLLSVTVTRPGSDPETVSP